MATYYFFNTDADEDWGNSNNWYFDSVGTIPANSVPSSSDDAVILDFLSYDSSSSATINNLFISSSNTTGLTITVLGLCTINGGYFGDNAAIIGDVLVTDNGYLLGDGLTGSIVGDLTFEGNGQSVGSCITDVFGGNVYFSSNWTGPSAGTINIIDNNYNVIFYYGYSGSANINFIGNGTIYYANYPTLYFNGAVNNDWNTLGNWWVDSGFTQSSYNLPTNSDSVIASTNITSSDGSTLTVMNFSTNSSLEINLTVTDLATFDNGGIAGLATITGNATFLSYGYNSGTVTGNATFYNNSYNLGSVDGIATFNHSSFNRSEYINTNSVFNSTFSGTNSFGTFEQGRAVLTFNNSLMNADWGSASNWIIIYDTGSYSGWVPKPTDCGIISTGCWSNFGDPATIYNLTIGTQGDTGSSFYIDIPVTVTNSLIVNGATYIGSNGNISANTIIFNDMAENQGSVSANSVTFNSYSANGSASYAAGSVTATTVTFNDNSRNNYPSTIDALFAAITTYFYNNSSNNGSIYQNVEFHNSSVNDQWGTLYYTTVKFYDTSYTMGSIYTPTVEFYNSSYTSSGGNSTIYESANFYDTSYNGDGHTCHNATFWDSSYNDGIVTVTANFQESSFNIGNVDFAGVTWNGLTGINSYGRFTDGQANPNQAGTLYFNSYTNDEDWSNLNNWWADSAYSIPAPFLPTSIDDAIIVSQISTQSDGSTIYLNNLTIRSILYGISTPIVYGEILIDGGSVETSFQGNMTIINNGNWGWANPTLNGNLTIIQGIAQEANISGDVTVTDGNINNLNIGGYLVCNGTSLITGNIGTTNIVVLNDYTTIDFYAYIGYDTILNDNSVNAGFSSIGGNATFNNNSINSASVSYDAIFNHNSYNVADGIVSGSATFNDASYTETSSAITNIIIGNRTPYPLRYGINNSNILGLI